MVGELAGGLIAIAVAIAVGLLPIWIILKKELGVIKDNKEEMRKTIEFLRKLTRYQIYEKIAMISTAHGRVPVAVEQVDFYKNQLLSDLRAVREVISELTEQQREQLGIARTRIIDVIGDRFDTAEINTVFNDILR
jgi:hypothetical protein